MGMGTVTAWNGSYKYISTERTPSIECTIPLKSPGRTHRHGHDCTLWLNHCLFPIAFNFHHRLKELDTRVGKGKATGQRWACGFEQNIGESIRNIKKSWIINDHQIELNILIFPPMPCHIWWHVPVSIMHILVVFVEPERFQERNIKNTRKYKQGKHRLTGVGKCPFWGIGFTSPSNICWNLYPQ